MRPCRLLGVGLPRGQHANSLAGLAHDSYTCIREVYPASPTEVEVEVKEFYDDAELTYQLVKAVGLP